MQSFRFSRKNTLQTYPSSISPSGIVLGDKVQSFCQFLQLSSQPACPFSTESPLKHAQTYIFRKSLGYVLDKTHFYFWSQFRFTPGSSASSISLSHASFSLLYHMSFRLVRTGLKLASLRITKLQWFENSVMSGNLDTAEWCFPVFAHLADQEKDS